MKIGSGSTSTVIENEDPNTVKKVFKQFVSPNSRKREIQILEALGDNPHVAHLVGHTDDYLILEKMQNENLFDLISADTFNIQRSYEICKDLIIAVDSIHKQGIVHRDLKLENILLSSTGKPILCDFGSSEFIGSNQVKRTIGTPQYMAPETLQTIPGTISTHQLQKADVFSLGVCIFVIIFRFFPFQKATDCKLWKLIKENQWDLYWQKINKTPSDEVKTLLKLLLQEDPAQRVNLSELYNFNLQ